MWGAAKKISRGGGLNGNISPLKLQPGSNTADNVRADVSARSICNPLERAFLDVRVYHTKKLS